MLKAKSWSRIFWTAICFLVFSVFLPLSVSGQRRWVTVRPHRSRIVVYQPRPYVVYQRRPNYSYRSYSYGYSQPYYTNRYYSSGYSQPYYTNQYYSYGYSQPYYTNRSTYSYGNPTYYYEGYRYRPQRRHNRFRVSIRLP
jgi:hypothetical protein